ncbi:NAD(P)H-dependent flavin oxidoreductase [Halocatena halophila]|uniref:NAD(P)H-dependent flavin oxidoreductase n=1 Tax=Halocatena halophila TaxID=2814576 RepID=UPI002ECFD261
MNELQTEITSLFGIDLPIVQAPIGSASCPSLAAAVTNAGGLGTLALSWRSPADARTALDEAMAQSTGPVGANIVLDETASTTDPETLVDCCLDAGVPIVSFSFGDCSQFVDRLDATDTTVLQSVGSLEAARSAVEAGVDCVVGQGTEAGGHVEGELTTLCLIPQLVDAVGDVPVIAAGGISDGRAIAAALTLGAGGAWLGTRFLATTEAKIHETYRSRLTTHESADTVLGRPFDGGWPGMDHRVLETEIVSEWIDAGRPTQDKPGAGVRVGTTPDGEPIDRYDDMLAVPDTMGEIEELPLYAGQGVGQIDHSRPAASVVDDLATETRIALTNAPG